MANITEQEIYEQDIYLLAVTDDVLGGEDGPSNIQAKQLANRTNWLKAELRRLGLRLDDFRTVGEVQALVASAYVAADYDATGLGVGDAEGWALCNGNNGTENLGGKFLVGFDATNPDYAAGATGGEERHTLTTNEMPRHTHDVQVYKSVTRQGDNGTNRTTVDPGYRDTFTSQATGGDQPHENRPPYYAIVYRQWVG